MNATYAFRAFVCAAGAGFLALLSPPDAQACGGCFHPEAESSGSVVTDHRMVFKISTTETILWDQVRYTGDPKEFAWVLPVREGAKVELSRDAWIAALDATTRTTVSGPERRCNNGGGGGSGGGGAGCGGGTEMSALSSASDNGSSDGARTEGSFGGNGDVQVLSQQVIGPYQAVTIRATGDQGIADWLTKNGFAIPSEVRPTIAAYTQERFDFIALRLRPGQGVQAMRPVRVVTPGADASMPLRMVVAGVGAKVGLTLWVIGEGRYRTQNFPEGLINYNEVVWDPFVGRSNLTTLQRQALDSNGGRVWITEAAERAGVLAGSVPKIVNGRAPSNATLYTAYRSQCIGRPPQTVRCTEDALPPEDGTPQADDDLDGGTAADAQASDAGTDASSDAAVTKDGGTSSPCTKVVTGCEGYDDLDVALRGLHPSDVWVTRLRADLPVTALADDLRLEATSEQRELSPQHQTDKFSDPNYDPCVTLRVTSSPPRDDSGGCVCRSAPPVRGMLGTFTLIGATALVASRIVRRRR